MSALACFTAKWTAVSLPDVELDAVLGSAPASNNRLPRDGFDRTQPAIQRKLARAAVEPYQLTLRSPACLRRRLHAEACWHRHRGPLGTPLH